MAAGAGNTVTSALLEETTSLIMRAGKKDNAEELIRESPE